MAIRSLGLVATFALSAQSFLLPPDLSIDSNTPDSDLSTWTLVDPSNQALLVPCEGCKTASSEDNNLFINISVGSEPGTLEIGGKRFYPPRTFLDGEMTENPYVLEVPPEVTLRDIRNDFSSYTDNEASVTSWGFAASRSETTENGDEILHMTVNIRMINMQRVNVPAIDLQVLKRPDGEMFIVTSKVNELEKHPHGLEQEDCDDFICRLRQTLEDKLHGISASMPKLGKHFGKGCHKGKGMKGQQTGRPFTNMHHGPNSHHHRPIGEHGGRHGHHPSHHHSHHNKLHRFLHRFGRFFMAVAAPILIGIAAGVATYAVGMVLGATIALIWVKLRGGRAGYASVALEEGEDDDDASIKGIDDDVEARQSYESAPPVYEEGEEVPAYEEKEISA